MKKRSNISSTALVIQAQDDKPLSKDQIKFNKQVRSMANLQKKLLKTSSELDDQLAFYQKKVAPLELVLYSTRKSLVKALFIFYKRKRKGITKREHELLGELIEEQLEQVLQREDAPDDELKTIFKKINGEGYEDSLQADYDFAKEELIEHLRHYGFDIDEDTFAGASNFEELHRAFEQKMEQQFSAFGSDADLESDQPFVNAGEPGKTKQKKTAAQLKKELLEKEKEAVKNRNIGVIYKQLAKIFHPDLEPDLEKKAEKEVLMKELTTAYSQKDLHTLLKLELSWIHQDENKAANLADEKLRIYNEILKEQIAELKRQLEAVKHHPQYREIQAVCNFERVTFKKLMDYGTFCQQMTDSMNASLTVLLRNDKDSIAEIKSILEEKAANDEIPTELDELMSAFMADQGLFDDDDFR